MRTVSSWAIAGIAAALVSAPLASAAQEAPSYAPPPAAPGVFEATAAAGGNQTLVVRGSTLTSQEDIEKYLLYRASMLTLDRKLGWFEFVRRPQPGDEVAPETIDPNAPAYAFRLEKFQPVWRYRIGTSEEWTTWSPFSKTPFLNGTDPARISAFEVTAEIAPKRGAFPLRNPLAFEAAPLSELLITQVKPPA